MFTWINKQGVQSSEGFVLQFTGRFTAEYREEDRVMVIDIEDGIYQGMPCVIVAPSAFLHWEGKDSAIPGVALLPPEQARVLDNFRQACLFQGLELVVEAR